MKWLDNMAIRMQGGPSFGSLSPADANTPQNFSQSPGADMLGALGASMLRNATMRPMQAIGTALSEYQQYAPEQAYRRMQMENSQAEMEDRRQKRLRESKLWTAMESDKTAPDWARLSPEAYIDFNKGSASQAAAQRIYSQYAPMFEGSESSEAGVSASDMSGGYDPDRVQQLYHLKAQAELRGDNNLAQAFGAEISRMQSAADLSIKERDLGIKQQELEWKTGGEERFKQNQTLQSEGMKARSAINVYQKLLHLTQSPDFYSGPMSSQVMKAKQLARNLGINPDGVKNIESFKALSNDAIRQEIGSLGTGVSNADVLFLSQANANLDFTPEGNRQLVGIKISLAQRKADIAQMARDYLKETGKKYLDAEFDEALAQWAEQNPIFPEAAQSQGSQPDNQQLRRGQTATNPQTGERMLWDGTQWRPMQ